MDNNPYKAGASESQRKQPDGRLLLFGFILFGAGIAIEECSRFVLAESFYQTLTTGTGVRPTALAEVFQWWAVLSAVGSVVFLAGVAILLWVFWRRLTH